MDRRGFLATLLGASTLAIVDPDALAWQPGATLISIPKTLHVPRIYQFGCDMDFRSELVWPALFEKAYLTPAFRAIHNLISKQLRLSGVAPERARFVPMEIPRYVENARYIDAPNGSIRDARFASVSLYDPYRGDFMTLARIDVLVKI